MLGSGVCPASATGTNLKSSLIY